MCPTFEPKKAIRIPVNSVMIFKALALHSWRYFLIYFIVHAVERTRQKKATNKYDDLTLQGYESTSLVKISLSLRRFRIK